MKINFCLKLVYPKTKYNIYNSFLPDNILINCIYLNILLDVYVRVLVNYIS